MYTLTNTEKRSAAHIAISLIITHPWTDCVYAGVVKKLLIAAWRGEGEVGGEVIS